VAKNTLPTYAIVELLIRLGHLNPNVGDYKDHVVYDDGVIVKTTFGNITFSPELIMQQFEHPENITDEQLMPVLMLFKPFK
jgi:hypothetical protein